MDEAATCGKEEEEEEERDTKCAIHHHCSERAADGAGNAASQPTGYLLMLQA